MADSLRWTGPGLEKQPGWQRETVQMMEAGGEEKF